MTPTRRVLFILLLTSCSCTHRGQVLDCPSTLHLDAPPEIGSNLPCVKESRCLLMTSPASLDASYTVEAQGINFDVAVRGSEATVVFVSVSDPSFRTPEGYRVGTPLLDITNGAGHELVQETGWACFVPLPSGWNAALPLTDSSLRNGLWVECAEQAESIPQIAWFFKRR